MSAALTEALRETRRIIADRRDLEAAQRDAIRRGDTDEVVRLARELHGVEAPVEHLRTGRAQG